MTELSRIGISLDSDLLDRFDRFISEQGYTNRSEAFRDLVRDRLVGSAVVAPNARVVGTVTLIYDHHARLLPERLTDLQHAHHDLVISTLHAHLDGDNCLEVILLRGPGESASVDRNVFQPSAYSTTGGYHTANLNQAHPCCGLAPLVERPRLTYCLCHRALR